MRIARPSAARWARVAAWSAVAVPVVSLTFWTGGPPTSGSMLFEPWLFSWLGGVALAAPPEPRPAAAPEPPQVYKVRRVRGHNDSFDSEGWFGIGLQCSDCTMARSDSSGVSVWQFKSPPEILWIDPGSPADKAGIEKGDVIVKVAGLPITSPEAGRRFGAMKPGESIQWTLQNDGKERTVTVVAAERPDRDVHSADMARELREARRQLDDAKRQLERNLRSMGADRNETGRRSLESALDQLEQTHREIERLMRENRTPRAYYYELPRVPEVPDVPDVPEPPDAPEPVRPRQNMRYEANVGDLHVEVRSTGGVGVSENKDGEIVIKTPESTIRIRKNR